MKTYLHKLGMTLALVLVSLVGWGQTYTVGFPNYSNLTATSVRINVSIDNPLPDPSSYRVRCIALLSSASAPSLTQVNGFKDAANITVATNLRGTVSLDEFTTSGIITSITGLSAGTSYTVYLVTYDLSEFVFIESQPTTISFTTPALPAPPTIQALSPADNATNVDVSGNLSVVFNKNVRFNTTATPHYIRIYKDASLLHTITCVSTVSSYSEGTANITTNTLTINPTDNLSLNSNYYITIDNGAIESTDNGIFAGFTDATTWNFSTPAPLTIVSYTPTPGTQTAPIADNISITFSENIALGAAGYLSIYKTGNGTFDDFHVSSTKLTINGATLTINPDPDFVYSTTYDILMDAGLVVSATSGVPCPAITDHNQWQFKTVDPPAPVTSLNPVNEATAIELQPTIKIMFDQPVRLLDGTSITNSNVESLITNFTSDEETPHVISSSDYVATINGTKDTITVNLSATLHESVKYTMVIARVENMIGQEQLNPTTSVFYTDTYIKWLGGTSDWGTTTNWSSNSVPTSAQSVRIEKAGSFDPVIQTPRTVRHLIINPDAALTIAASGNLTVGKKFDMLSSPSNHASLIIDGGLSVQPANVSIHQGITQEAWKYFISSPVAGATQSNMGTGIIEIKEYNSSVPTWSPISNTTALTAGKGYVATGTSGSNMVFRGTINNGDSYTFNAIRTITPKNNFGWNLAGNPYPCGIDWDLITKNNMTNGFWMWLNDSQKYGTYNGVSGLGANLNETSPNIIPSGHSFWAQVLLPDPNTTNTSGSIEIPRTARTSNTPSYLKAASSNANKAVLRLVGFNGTTEDEIVTALIDGASDSFDPYDSEKQFSGNGDLVQLYSLAGNTKCAINSFDMTAFDGEMVIPIGFKAINASNNESFGIGLKSVSGLPDDIVIELEDTKNSNKKVLTASSHYCFSSVANVDDPNRFKLHLKSASTSTSVSKSPVNNGITVTALDQTIIIDIPSVENSSYQLSDVNGQLLSSGALYSETGNRIQVNKTGLVIVKVISANKIFTSKILIK
jgi:hypothetical protein